MNKRTLCMIIAMTALVIAVFLSSLPAAPSLAAGPSRQNDECGSCHSGFIAFSPILDAPTEVPENYDFEYKVRVENDWKHEVKELSTTINIENGDIRYSR